MSSKFLFCCVDQKSGLVTPFYNMKILISFSLSKFQYFWKKTFGNKKKKYYLHQLEYKSYHLLYDLT